MAISKTKNYLVLNHSASPVGVSTKYDSFMIDGGSPNSPGSLPLSFDEIAVINSKSQVFKIGILRFEPEYEAELYEELSIPRWREILTQDQIEEMLQNPTIEGMQRILDIENEAYFERIRGAMISLRNRGMDITVKVERMIEQRREELARRQRKTTIKLIPHEEESPSPSQAEFDAMKKQLEAMQAMMAQLVAANATTGSEDVNEDKAEVKPAAKAQNKKPKSNSK